MESFNLDDEWSATCGVNTWSRSWPLRFGMPKHEVEDVLGKAEEEIGTFEEGDIHAVVISGVTARGKGCASRGDP